MAKAQLAEARLRHERAAMVSTWPPSNRILLRSQCAWALVRIGNVAQAKTVEPVPVAKTLDVLISHFRRHFFDKKTQRWVGACAGMDAMVVCCSRAVLGGLSREVAPARERGYCAARHCPRIVIQLVQLRPAQLRSVPASSPSIWTRLCVCFAACSPRPRRRPPIQVRRLVPVHGRRDVLVQS